MQPVTRSIKRHFRCHISHSSPTVLYRLFYYVQVPTASTTTSSVRHPRFQTAKLHRTVASRPGDLQYSQRGRYDVDFLTAEHDTGLQLRDDFVLTAVRAAADDDDEEHWNYSVSPSTVSTPAASETSSVHTVSENVFVAAVQPQRPFGYSTSTWLGDCNKNVSTLRQMSDEHEDDTQNVHATVHSTPDEHFSYFLKSATGRPYIRFTVPDGKSVLPFFFRNSTARLLINESLKVSLKLSAGGRVWLIHVAGKMSDCPSYLGITINDRLQSEQLINYDLFVFCPPQFDVTFWLPNWGQRAAKTFDVQLRDSQRTHVVFLTHLLLDPVAEQSALTTKTPVDDSDDRELPTLFAAVTGLTLTAVLLVITLCFRLRSTSGVPSKTAVSGLKRKHGRPCRVCAYVTVRVVYSIAVSFATVLLTLSVLMQSDVELLSGVEDRLSAVASDASIDYVDRAAGNEALRQVRDGGARHSACTHYVNQLYAVVLERVAKVHYNHSQCVGGSSSVAMERLETAVKRYVAVTHSAVDDYDRRVSATISQLASLQTRHLAQLYNNDWSNFAVKMFNNRSSHTADRHLHSLPDDVAAALSRPEVDFASFVGIDVIRETKVWLDQFWRRYNDSYEAAWSESDVSSTWSHLLTTSTCYVDRAHSDSVDRLLQRLLDASHADTTRYHVTDSRMTSSNDDERRDDVTQEVESAAWLEEFWSDAWTLLIALDVLLVVARATITYVNATDIYRGGRRAQQQTLSYHQPIISAINHCIANGQAGSAACPRLKVRAADRTSRRTTWTLVLDAISSRSLLFVVCLSSLVALLYLAARVAASSAAVNVINDVIYDVYTLRVRAHRSMSDAVVREQARLTTSTLMQSAQQFDLLALRVFNQYFQLGVKNMTDCDDVGPLDDVLLPCQFLPVLPITNTGVGAVMEFEQQLLSDLRRYTAALQRLGITVINTLLFVVLTAITTRLISYIICWSRDPHHSHSRDPVDDDITPTRPATVSVNAETRNFTVFDLRFSETKV